MTRDRDPRVNIKLKKLLHSDASSGVVLIVAAIAAIVLANNGTTQPVYQTLLAMPVEFRLGALDISKNLLLWINDGLMAIFFLMVGLEIKRELIMGALARREQALFPLIAAVGGMIVPALLFLSFNGSDASTRSGWAIPTATDIAFALGVLALLGNRIPPTLKIFLMALAIIDDLGAIVVIALFYTSDLSMASLGIAALAVAVLALMNRLNVRNTGLYLLVGIVLWTAVLKSGVHATLAGVVVGLLIPLAKKKGHSPAIHLEHALHPWVRWAILPLFAFANAGIVLEGLSGDSLFSLLPLGIIIGLFIGKPLGITLFCWLAVKAGLATLPENTRMSDITAVGVLCGIGFTMSIFIASLAWGAGDVERETLAKLGILLGSLLSAVVGYGLLWWRLGRHRA